MNFNNTNICGSTVWPCNRLDNTTNSISFPFRFCPVSLINIPIPCYIFPSSFLPFSPSNRFSPFPISLSPTSSPPTKFVRGRLSLKNKFLQQDCALESTCKNVNRKRGRGREAGVRIEAKRKGSFLKEDGIPINSK